VKAYKVFRAKHLGNILLSESIVQGEWRVRHRGWASCSFWSDAREW